jgi:tRNA dimethylallyltransferase
MHKIIALGGLTASGKTDISIKLAKEFPLEIINADSRQVYKQIDIGTAKLEIEEHCNKDGTVVIKGIVHHLIDFVDLKEEFNLAKFQKLAYEKVRQIWERDKTPFLVGGTGLYIDAVIRQYELSDQQINEELRNNLQDKSVKHLQQKLIDLSKETFEKLTPSDKLNKHRLIRRIEKILHPPTQKPNTERLPKFKKLYMALKLPKDKLLDRIEKRVDKMLKQGLIEENKELRKKGYTTELRPLKTIGYQEFEEYFTNKKDLADIKQQIIISTRQYAKRQETYFNRHDDIQWIDGYKDAADLVTQFLEK